MTTATMSSNASSSSSILQTKRQALLTLDTQKSTLQTEAQAIISELTAPTGEDHNGPPIGIDTPLVDHEGFPRADIDVYRARSLRKRLKELGTDYKALEKRVDDGLVEIASIHATTASEDEQEMKLRKAPKPKPKFDAKTGKWVVKSWDGSVAGVDRGEIRKFADLADGVSTAALASIGDGIGGVRLGGGGGIESSLVPPQQDQQSSVQHDQQQQQQQVTFTEEYTTPFAVIDEISPNSPASTAGLQNEDILLQFGSVHSANHDNFRGIARLLPVAASENESINVAVRRKSMTLGGLVEVIKTERLVLVPKVWGGRGLLGCHVRPYNGE